MKAITEIFTDVKINAPAKKVWSIFIDFEKFDSSFSDYQLIVSLGRDESWPEKLKTEVVLEVIT